MRRALFDFKKVLLPPGGNVTIQFKISAKALARADKYDGALVSAPGEYLLVLTSGNDDDKATIIMPLTVTGAAPAVIEEFPPKDSVEDDQLVQL